MARVLLAAASMWLLDIVSTVLMVLRLRAASKSVDAAIVRIGFWSGVITDGRD